MPEFHHKFGGSGCARLLQCPGYLYASRNIPPKGGSVHSIRGTNLHDIQEHLRKNDLQPEDIDIQKMFPQLSPEELKEFTDITLSTYNRTENILNDYDSDYLEIEPFVSGKNPDTGGSIDLLGYNDTHVVMVDYKFGHIQVFAEQNAQGLFYFMVLSQDPKYKHIVEGKSLTFVIEQPNQDSPSVWDIPEGELERFITRFEAAQAEALTENPPLTAGKYCTFCPNDAYCHEKRAYAQRALTLDPHDRDSLLESIELAMQLNTWKTTVMAEAERLLEGGEQIKGYKLVQKRATRKWKNVDLIVEAMKGRRNKTQYFTPPKLLSPAQIEKLHNVPHELQVIFDKQIEKVSSGTTIVPESDKREAVRRVIPDALKALTFDL